MRMNRELQRFLLVGQTIAPFAINALVNGAIAWAVYRGLAALPLWGDRSISGDTLVTSFLLPLIICLLVTPLIRAQATQGKAPMANGGLPGWLRIFSHPLLLRALLLGIAATLVVGGATVALLAVSGMQSLALSPFLAFKSIYAGGLAAIVTPMVAWLALADPQSARR
ncbi:hypothetical protein [Lysobacter fragariae]